MSSQFRNLVFEGRGVEIVAYAGALEVLDDKGILQEILRIGATSAGAIVGLLVGLHYSPDECRTILKSFNLSNVISSEFGVQRDAQHLLSKLAWYKSDIFRDWISEIVRGKTGNGDSTFNDIQEQALERGFRAMYFIATNLCTEFAEIFSFEHTPRVSLADAVCLSMCLPFFMKARQSPRGDIYVDGGMLDSYPIRLFDREKYSPEVFSVLPYYEDFNKYLGSIGKIVSPYVYNMETLGFRLDSPEELDEFRDQSEPERMFVYDLFDYTWALMNTVFKGLRHRHLPTNEWHRTIYIDTLGIDGLYSPEDSRMDDLAESGKNCTKQYFEWFDDPANSPINRKQKVPESIDRTLPEGRKKTKRRE